MHSLVNRRLVEAAAKKRNVTVRDMYNLYQDKPIDVATERAVLETADRMYYSFHSSGMMLPF